ncbi:2-amino-4-hydroxy-6-hydroxymethyldihydropteridine diphosphokinase [Croceicoccus estronivorus]|uniref:2-amino-4-hydroxy-6- hydroxymethyldihydropteridine diphosphokinase n=1 Tax=Croceicoccus estronivorus TaxID=1172626 RepID=UPI00082B28C4|nr:2-amino-4-hydroxy-6-hydroxymethyldihydropteridine diphosphokinase [Croceicoccus estronivorus]OCC22885.1 2-amino-4-hydroxy-6-hydroxymethyldihydropteridine diphosphokinase [Croceicoccus estronivorus]
MSLYLIALGSNLPHHRYGSPRMILAAALDILVERGCRLVKVARPVSSAPLGPSRRTYANSVAIVECALAPEPLLDLLQAIERDFGRKRVGRRWRARVLDLDVILWSGGFHASPRLTIPHPQFRLRRFVLGPATTIAPGWRDPVTGLTVRQLFGRLTRNRPLPRAPAWSGP